MAFKCFVFSILILYILACGRKKDTLRSPTFSKADTLLSKGKLLEQTNYIAAYACYIEALDLAKSERYVEGTFKAYRYLIFNVGILQGNFKKGIAWDDEGLAEAQKESNAYYSGEMLSMRAMMFHAHSKLDSAAVYYKKAIYLLEKEKRSEALLPLYNNISGLYNLLGNHQLAKEYMQRYITIVAHQKDTASLIGAYSNMYLFCTALRDTAQGEQMLMKAKKLLAKMPYNDAGPMVYSNLSEMYNSKRQYDSAQYYSQKRLQQALALDDTMSIIKSYNSLLVSQFGLNELTAVGNSLQALQRYMQKFEPTLYLQRDVTWHTYQYNKRLGHVDASFEALEKYNTLNIEIRKMEVNKDLEQFEQERARNKHEENLLNNQLQINKRNTAILLLCALLVLLAGLGISSILWLKKRQALQQKQMIFLEKEKDWNHSRALLEAQLEERNRISRELHDDLGASLTSIVLVSKLAQSKSEESKIEELELIATSSTEMVQTLNDIVWALNSRNDSLQSLIAYMRKFAISFLSKAGIGFSYSENLPENDIRVNSNIRRSVYLTAKEALNNLVKHSRATRSEMSVDFESDRLTIRIKDNGHGFSEQVSQGNGIINMHKNMAQVKGTLIIEQKGGVTVKIQCSLNHANL